MNGEPIGIESIKAIIVAIIALVVSFGVDLSADQQTSIIGAVAVLAPLYVWYQARKKVVPVEKANAAVTHAVKVSPTTPVAPLLFKKG